MIDVITNNSPPRCPQEAFFETIAPAAPAITTETLPSGEGRARLQASSKPLCYTYFLLDKTDAKA